MKLSEIASPLKLIEDYIVYIKMKGVDEVPLSSIAKEVHAYGFTVEENELEDILKDIPFISKIENGKAILNKVSEPEKEDTPDKSDRRVSQMANAALKD